MSGAEFGYFCGKFDRGLTQVLSSANIVEPLSLVEHSLGNLEIAITEGIRAGMRTHHVQILASLDIGNVRAGAVGKYNWPFLLQVGSRHHWKNAVLECQFGQI